MCEFKSFPKEIEYSSEDKIKKNFLDFFVFTYSLILILYNLTFSSFFFFNFYYASNLFFCFCLFFNKIILFHENWRINEAIILCYNRENFVKMSAKVPPFLTWHTCQIIIGSLGHVVSPCIMNEFKGHWLLSDALTFAISMNLKFRDEIDSATFDNLTEKMEMLL